MSGSRLLSSKDPSIQKDTFQSMYHYPSDSDAYHHHHHQRHPQGQSSLGKLSQRRTKFHRNPNRFAASTSTSNTVAVTPPGHIPDVHYHEHSLLQSAANRRALRRNVRWAQRLKNRKIEGLTHMHNLHSLWISQLIKLDDPVEKHMHCICHCKSYDLDGISKRFKDVHEIFYIFARYTDALHFRMRADGTTNGSQRDELQMVVDEKDIFVFQNEGVIVSWNLSKAERNTFIRMLKPFRDEYPIDELSPGVLPQSDKLNYELGTDFQVENHTVTLSLLHCFDQNYIENWDDHIDEYVVDTKFVDALQLQLAPPNVIDQHEVVDTDLDEVSSAMTTVKLQVDWKAVRCILMMQKLAVSFGVAQATKLTVFELRIDDNIAMNDGLSTQMAVHGSVGLNTKTIIKRMGRLFIARSELNLRSDVLDTPEHFYENDMFLNGFYRVREYLNIDKRLEVINARFRLMNQLYQIVMHQQETAHGSKLEWIVIWLIVVCVIVGCLEAFTIYFRHF